MLPMDEAAGAPCSGRTQDRKSSKWLTSPKNRGEQLAVRCTPSGTAGVQCWGTGNTPDGHPVPGQQLGTALPRQGCPLVFLTHWSTSLTCSKTTAHAFLLSSDSRPPCSPSWEYPGGGRRRGGGCDHPDAPKAPVKAATRHGHPARPVSPVILCILPLTAAGHSRADRRLVQTLTKRERERKRPLRARRTTRSPHQGQGRQTPAGQSQIFPKRGRKESLQKTWLAWRQEPEHGSSIQPHLPSAACAEPGAGSRRCPGSAKPLCRWVKAEGRPQAQQLKPPDLSVSLMVPPKFNGTMQLHYLKSHNICWYDSFITVDLYIFVDKRGHLGRHL